MTLSSYQGISVRWISLLACATVLASCAERRDPDLTPKAANPTAQSNPNPTGQNPFDPDPVGTQLNQKSLFNISSDYNKTCAERELRGIYFDPLFNNEWWKTDLKQINFCVDGMTFNIFTERGLVLDPKKIKAYLYCQVSNRSQSFNPSIKVDLNTTVEEVECGRHYRVTTQGKSTQMKLIKHIHAKDILFGEFTTATGCGFMVHVEGGYPEKNGRKTRVQMKHKGEIDGAVYNVKNFDDLEGLHGFLVRDDLTTVIQQWSDGMRLDVGAPSRTSRDGAVVRVDRR